MAKRQDIPEGEYLKGLRDVVDNIQQAVNKMEHTSVVGLADALLFVAEESQQRAPVETGDLRGSVEVKIDNEDYAYCEEYRADKANHEKNDESRERKDYVLSVQGTLPETASRGEVSYNTKYAANQHEHTEYDHPLGGQAKYLESVMVEHKQRILQLIANGVVSGLKGDNQEE